MSGTIDPGVGWRLLEIGEVIEPSDQFFSCGGGWRTVVSVSGERFHPDDQCPIRRSTTKDSTQGDRTSAELARLQSENADLRQQLADAKERLAERTVTLQRQTDYSIALQIAIEAHRRGARVTGNGCQHHADMLNADLELTEQRACEIVCQMRRDGRLDVSDESCGWFTPVGPENWQCRPAPPKPVTKPVTLPPDKWTEIEAAIVAAGGSV